MADRYDQSDLLHNPELALNVLQESLRNRDQEIQELDKQIEILKQQNKELPGKKNGLEKEIDYLQKEVGKLEKEKTELEKVRSSSRDARKMYGDSTPGDVTHEQVALEYKTFFKDAFRKLPQNITGADKYELWEMASTMFTEAYGICRTEVVQKMLEEIHRVAVDDSCLGKTDEKTTDICRAYEILADVANLKKPLDDDEKTELQHQILQKVHDKVDQSDIKRTDILDAIDIAWSTIGTVTPAGQQKLLLDYASKLKESKPSYNVGDEGRRGEGRGGGGIERGRREGGGRREGDGGRSGGEAWRGGGGNNYGRDAPREQYPAPTRPSDRPLAHDIVGFCTRCKTHIYRNTLFKRTHNGLFCETCLCPACTEPLERSSYSVNDRHYHQICAEACNACGTKFSRNHNPACMANDRRLLCRNCYENYGHRRV